MPNDLLYNATREEIVNFLASRENLDKYIINTSATLPVSRIFSRNTKFSIWDLLAFMIMPREESTTVELAQFAEITGKDPVCKQTFFSKRRQIKDSIFDDINHRCVTEMFLSKESGMDTYNGLHLLSFDGTTIKLPDTPEIATRFPKGKEGDDHPLARMEVVKDVLNGTIIDMQVDSMAVSEVTLAIRAIKTLSRDLLDQSVLIYDRGYLGAGWFTWLQNNDIQYIVRLPRGFNKQVDAFFKSKEDTADVLVEMSSQNWNKKGKKSFDALGLDPANCPPVLLHLVKCKLTTGETEVLAVRIKSGMPSSAEAYILYGYRWGVETTISELKNQLQIEVFSGNSVLSLLQDIKAKFIGYNIGTAIAKKATASLDKSRAPSSSHPNERVKVNLNISWYFLKQIIPQLLICSSDNVEQILTETIKNLKCNIEEYELGRHVPHPYRPPHSQGKYITYTNYKRAI